MLCRRPIAIKVTTTEDLAAAERLIAARRGDVRVGQGFDAHAFTAGDQVRICGIEIPHALSLLAFHDLNGRAQGLDAVPRRDRPPVNVVRFSFQAMVGIGTGLALLGLVYLVMWWRRRRLPRSVWFYRGVVAAAPLSVTALICGWVTTEVGRQPWIVYRVMRTSEAVTGANGIPLGYGFLVAVYLALGAVVVVMLRRIARRPVELEAETGS